MNREAAFLMAAALLFPSSIFPQELDLAHTKHTLQSVFEMCLTRAVKHEADLEARHVVCRWPHVNLGQYHMWFSQFSY